MSPPSLPSLDVPGAAAWDALIAWFGAHPEACQEAHPALVEARAALAAWPESVLRPIPYRWIFRMVSPRGFAPAALGNALCVGDRWAFHCGIQLSGFQTLTDAQSARLARLALPLVHTLDLSLQSVDNPYSPGTMVDASITHSGALLRGGALPRVRALDCSGIGISTKALRRLEGVGLQVLVLREADVDEEFLAALAGSPLMRGLVHLDLRCNALYEDELRALLSSPHLGGLRVLKGVDLSDPDTEDEIRRLVEASSLADDVKRALLAEEEGPASIFFDPAFPGPVGSGAEDEDEDEFAEDEEDEADE
jgi:hypothetical protein